jgi:hypothetical protein
MKHSRAARQELEGSGSFLKKRTKKLFFLKAAGRTPRAQMSKSFLVLFFKKELLASHVPSL